MATDLGGPSRKRVRGASSDELPPWECDPTSRGVVHPSGCSLCRPYISHVSEAKAAHSTSIERAFKDLNDQLDTYFFDGVAEGRRRQKADDADRLRELERAVSRLRLEREGSEQQLSVVKDQLRLVQSEYAALRTRLEPSDEILVEPRETPSVDPAIPFIFPSLSSSKPEPIPTSKSEATVPTFPLPPRPTVEVIASSGAAPRSESLRATPSQHGHSSSHWARGPKTLRQLQQLMNKAHQPRNDDALARVKLLCAEAHQIPREQKNDLQRYILSNWRNPDASSMQPPPLPPPPPPPPPAPLLLLGPRANNPRMEDPVEVWHAYLTTHQGSWPRGVRRKADGSPHLSDLKASRTVARLRPAIGERGDTTLRTEFMACAVQVFASPGMYRDLLRRNSVQIAPVVDYQPYRATQFSVTAVEVVRHFAAAGVSVDEAVAELEPWAQEYQAQSAMVFPAGGSGSASASASAGGHHSKKASRSRSRQHDFEDRFGWR
ncbi:hypothetical protein FB45DRAFT_738206 [Roridomyces roridus]|uniref:Uncharacterized protein n=1 Tax=Roridomyces roridus TaxID=1738132 RepID=A0AAD7C890_9AGAR|nr:hypothetical protein FB45DRAFT_738206 [Roridomyces roridus]